MNKKQISITNAFVSDIKEIINSSRDKAVRSVEFYRVQMYWQLGKRIFNEEQGGKERAEYGTFLIKNLAKELEPLFGTGFSSRQLARSRQFYREYQKVSALRSQFNWFQYRTLISISDKEKREYYELETVKNSWNGRELEFFADLVFYNRLLKCFVIVELKTNKMTHQDLGQLQMYVNYYDRYEKSDDEKPTIGILLTPSKNHAIVELTLPKESNVYASEYKLYLPEKELLENEVEKWVAEFEKSKQEDR
ncbi:MAG: PDDEXK nuclease domain-containing protein [Sulfurimonas sp.]|nr:PDDEXK nuclease domain-containing protein [Sulfurimonas sp.]